MSIKGIAGVACFVLTAVALVSAIRSVYQGPGLADPTGLGVSHAVGAFLPAMLLAILGTWLFTRR